MEVPNMVEPAFNSQDEVILLLNEKEIGVFTYTDAKQMICNLALKYNCGIARNWMVDNTEFWDIGPKVFSIRHI